MIDYNDPEVDVFHPICGNALNNALNQLNLNSNYRVIHHKRTVGSLEPDFVIENMTTGKILCVIEVKRTRQDLNSSRYQFQAMSYVQSNVKQSEKPYYILTNLERAILFRFNESRLRPYQQIVAPGISEICDLKKQDEDHLCASLTDYLKKVLSLILEDKGEYFLTLDNFAEEISIIQKDPKQWKTNIAMMFYEYIRGAFDTVGRTGLENGLEDIRVFRNNIEEICDEGSRIDFSAIFDYCSDTFNKTGNVDKSLLSDLYEYAKLDEVGDAISDTLHQVVSEGHEHEGEVLTDLELAKIVSALAHSVSGDLKREEKICDPAAGSGNLISSAITEYNLFSDQIIANDWNPYLLEVLSLRLGLHYASSINRANSPKVTCENIANLDKDYFSQVGVLIMNPPFVAGINCIERKQPLFTSIEKITGKKPLSLQGQIPLENVFIELITDLLKDGTTIATVFPKSQLNARGPEAQTLRKFLLEKFGLRKIFVYPRNGIFEDVIKDTCVLVGKINQPSNNIDIVTCLEDIPEIDVYKLKNSLEVSKLDNQFRPIIPGIEGRVIPRKTLKKNYKNGWRELNINMVRALEFIQKDLESNSKLTNKCSFPIKRGIVGNKGASDLFFLDSSNQFNTQDYKGLSLNKFGFKNAFRNEINVDSGDSFFLNLSDNPESIVDDLLKDYIALPKKSGKQPKKTKSLYELKDIGKTYSKGAFPENSVLLPRAIREKGKVYLSSNELFVSTNFIVFMPRTKKEAILLASWMVTIFYQLLCEVSSKDEAGLRKMEISDAKATLFPKFDSVSEETYDKVKEEMSNIEFLDLNNPKVRKIDNLWAQELFGEQSSEKLDTAQRLLKYLSNVRNR